MSNNIEPNKVERAATMLVIAGMTAVSVFFFMLMALVVAALVRWVF